MVKPHTAIVVTTIFEPAFLAGYLENLRENGRAEDTSIYVIIDRKTPPSVARAAEDARKAGFDVRCPSLDGQERFLHRLDVPDDFIPYDSDNRRNIGFLMALEQGCDVLVSIDDDNYCRAESDFVGEHRSIGNRAADAEVSSSDGWFNICSLLETDVAVEVFPRGFPYFARKTRRHIRLEPPADPSPVAMNAGLWLDDPDVDAVSRLSPGPRMHGFSGKSVLLGREVWSPINTQNTALSREAALSYYYVRMGYPLQGMTLDRYGDILSGYFTQKCIKHLGQTIRVGTPVADHRRTPHNLFKDLYHELAGMVLIEELLPWLIEEPLEGSTYLETYASLVRLAGRPPGRGGAAFQRFHLGRRRARFPATNGPLHEDVDPGSEEAGRMMYSRTTATGCNYDYGAHGCR